MTKNKNEQLSILVVDDVPKNFLVLGRILRQEGYSIAFATSGKQALEMIISDPYDLILLDVMMPEMDGFEVCARLKEIPERKAIPVIFLTAKTEADDIVMGFHAGATDYVTKPFNPAELRARVRSHLELKRSRDKLQQANEELTEKNRQLSLLNQELHKALREIKTLQGLLPICPNCKRIRKEGGPLEVQDSWMVLEGYLIEHTKALFTHSICPECMRKLYPKLIKKK